MKRYNFEAMNVSFGPEPISVKVESDTGSYVTYETAQKFENACELYREALNIDGELLKTTTATGIILFNREKEIRLRHAEQLYKEAMEG